MKTRKFLAFALAAIMALSASINVLAADIITDGGSQDVTVTYGTNQGFVVTIPSSIAVVPDIWVDTEISASDVVIPHGTTLDVTISSNDWNGSWELVDKEEASNTLKYQIQNSNGDSIYNGDVVLSVASGEAYNKVVTSTLSFYIDDVITKAGTYQDTLTFTVGVVDDLLSFTISGVIYNAKPGMTWEEWIDSDYNTGNYHKENAPFISNGNGLVLEYYEDRDFPEFSGWSESVFEGIIIDGYECREG